MGGARQYQKAKRDGVCPRCRRPPGKGRIFCRGCSKESYRRQKTLRRKKREAKGWGECLWCRKQLAGKHRVTCSRSCTVSVCKRRYKLKAIQMKGGKCQSCGYKRCIGSLSFHHRDPSKKEFHGFNKPWRAIVKELKKCDLLCLNCHGEEHHVPRPIDVGY